MYFRLLMYPVQINPLYRTHVSCLLSHVSCLTSPVYCLTVRLLSHVSCLLSHVPCLTSPVSRLLSIVSRLLSIVSRPLSHVSCLLSHVSYLTSPVYCLTSPVSGAQHCAQLCFFDWPQSPSLCSKWGFSVLNYNSRVFQSSKILMQNLVRKWRELAPFFVPLLQRHYFLL